MELKKTEKYNMQHKLAIVIPAYKAKYLSETLDSIASQTDKRFCVYIGDDCSPEKIDNIVSQYKDKFNYVYQHFDTNLGGKDLVAQWERCIAMTQGEEWIWLFSDDDYMDSTCVEAFYNELNKESENIDLFRYNLNILNHKEISYTSKFPSHVTPSYLFRNKMEGKCNVFAVEYIFSRKIYENQGKFQTFDLAWNSDIATWMKFGRNGIVTIDGPAVTWRNSGMNITTKSDSKLEVRKWKATVTFFIWLKNFFKKDLFYKYIIINFYFIKAFHGAAQILPMRICMDASKDYFWHTFK